jgi:hypothetical protein
MTGLKRYLLFAGFDQYPSGGWFDFEGDFDVIDDAIVTLQGISRDWWYIVDTHLPKPAIVQHGK